jgi:glucose-6-phosphate 1-dehydrogenase
MIHTQTAPRASASKPAPDCTLVIFGITGDLTHRLLMPALYNLALWNLLPENFAIVGLGRSEFTVDALRDDLTATMRGFIDDKRGEFSADSLDQKAWGKVVGQLDYLTGDLDDPATYEKLSNRIAASQGTHGNGPDVLFYLAVAARFFGPVVKRLGDAGLNHEREGGWRRVVIEKPFGHDLASAQALNRDILTVFKEDQIFRIDHFLGKETVQNIMAFRFGNGLFEPLWNRDRIDHVQITVAETVGVEKRGSFYDSTGALRDMVPNHLFQLFTMTAMEPPISFDANAVRDKKEEVLMAVRQPSADAAVRAQYTTGAVLDRPVRDYREEPDVDPTSQTETYVALRLMVDNWRWAGVPFYLRTGKAMTKRDTEIAIQFKQAPLALFRGTAVDACIPNWLVLQIQPDEGISLQFGAKVPGPEVQLGPVTMNFLYKDYFQTQPSTGYETLIYDAMIGDATLFQRADHIEASWQAVQPFLDAWASGLAPMASYPAGDAGPREADDLLARDGRAWRPL